MSLLPLFACVFGVFAATPVTLPPGEDKASWEDAFAEARQLVPDLEAGDATAGTPGVVLYRSSPLWAVEVETAQGVCPPFPVLPPETEASRREILVLAAYVLETATCVVPPAASSPYQPWLRMMATLDLPGADSGGNTNVGLQVGGRLIAPIHGFVGIASATDRMGEGASAVGVRGLAPELGVAWLPGERIGARVAMSGGLSRRWYDTLQEEVVTGAWVPFVEASAGVRVPLPAAGIRLDSGLSWTTDLRPVDACGAGCVNPPAVQFFFGLDVDLETGR